jgi:hypothetical protein
VDRVVDRTGTGNQEFQDLPDTRTPCQPWQGAWERRAYLAADASPSEIQALNRSVIAEFRAGNGMVTHPRLKNAQLVLLTAAGASTGRLHTTPLAYFSGGPGRVVLWASAMAAPAHPPGTATWLPTRT